MASPSFVHCGICANEKRNAAIRNGKWDFNRGKALTNAEKIAAAKQKSAATKRAKEKASGNDESRAKDSKEIVGRELGFRKVPGKKGKVLGGGKEAKVKPSKAEKKKSCFDMVMAQDSDREGASVGIGMSLDGGIEKEFLDPKEDEDLDVEGCHQARIGGRREEVSGEDGRFDQPE